MSTTMTNRRQAVAALAASAVLAATARLGATAGPNYVDTGGDVGGPDGPVRITFLFGQPEDQDEFERHYAAIHLPLVMRVPGLVRMESSKGAGSLDGTSSAFYRANTLTFRSQHDMMLAKQSSIGAAALADLDRFATGGVTATIVQNIDEFDPPATGTLERFRNGVDPREP